MSRIVVCNKSEKQAGKKRTRSVWPIVLGSSFSPKFNEMAHASKSFGVLHEWLITHNRHLRTTQVTATVVKSPFH